MAYYLVSLTNSVLCSCKSKIEVLCSIFGMLDYYKKLALIVYLAEYITVKNIGAGYIKDDKYYITHTDVINSYEQNMRPYIGRFLEARDESVHLPDTPKQIQLWNMMWDEGYVKKIPEYEGFM